MTVLYDYQTFERDKVGGISRYFFEIINNFQKNRTIDTKLPIEFSSNEYLKNSLLFNQKIKGSSNYYNDFLWNLEFKGKGRLFELRNIFFSGSYVHNNKKKSIEYLKNSNFNLFHPTYYDDYFLDYIGDKPFVITVFDMIHEIYPEYFSLDDSTAKNKKRIFGQAKKIISISESSKKDLINLYDIDEGKIEVIYLANSLNPVDASYDKSIINNLPKQYLLFVGGRSIYKNFYFFMHAILPLLKKDDLLQIVTTGVNYTKSEINFFKQLGILDRVRNYYVNDESLSFLYQNAIAFVFPSLYEGFGLPVLESFACGCPAILSNTSSLPEVGGDAAIYFEPKNTLSILEAVEKVIYDDKLKDELRRKGYEQLKEFSWEKTAQKTFEVYKEVLQP